MTVTWSRSDADSGVGRVDVQYKIDSGGWVDWYMNTSATEAVFPGRPDHLYTFQLTVTDNVGPEKQTTTTVST